MTKYSIFSKNIFPNIFTRDIFFWKFGKPVFQNGIHAEKACSKKLFFTGKNVFSETSFVPVYLIVMIENFNVIFCVRVYFWTKNIFRDFFYGKYEKISLSFFYIHRLNFDLSKSCKIFRIFLSPINFLMFFWCQKWVLRLILLLK